MKKYKVPLTYENLEEQDAKMEAALTVRYKEDIDHFKRTAELYISLFANGKRTNREEEKLDYMQLVAVRIFQDSRSALLLGLKGLYPQSIGLTRGVLESMFLLYDFKLNPKNEDLWFDAGKNKREELFKASEVRKRVSQSRANEIEIGKGLYGALSDWTVHPNREAFLWYIEVVDKTVYFHWSGHGVGKRADITVLSSVFSLAQGLFVLIEEGIYSVPKEWLDDYLEWKKKHLEFAKRFGKLFGDEEIQKVEMKMPEFVIAVKEKL